MATRPPVRVPEAPAAREGEPTSPVGRLRPPAPIAPPVARDRDVAAGGGGRDGGGGGGTTSPPAGRQRQRQRRRRERQRRRSRVLLPLVGSVAALAVLFGAVFPTRAVLAQRAELDAAERELAELEAENAALEARIEDLGTDDEIERIAREQYNLVYPGEEAYALMPPPPAPSPPWAALATLEALLGAAATRVAPATP